MIKNRLSILLAEKGLKVTRVAKDTGISRNTITATAQNDSEMIRLETINRLCKYLNITPSDFFDYEPLDIDFSLEVNSLPFKLDSDNDRRILRCSEIDADLFMDIDWGDKKESYDLTCELLSEIVIKEKRTISEEEAGYTIQLKIKFEEEEEGKSFSKDIYNEINGTFHKDIYNSLNSVVNEKISKEIIKNVDHFIENHLNTEYNPSYIDPFQDSFFANDLTHFKNNLEIKITSDIFRPF